MTCRKVSKTALCYHYTTGQWRAFLLLRLARLSFRPDHWQPAWSALFASFCSILCHADTTPGVPRPKTGVLSENISPIQRGLFSGMVTWGRNIIRTTARKKKMRNARVTGRQPPVFGFAGHRGKLASGQIHDQITNPDRLYSR